MKTMKIAITTLGCKVNQYDSVTIEEAMLAKGFQIVDFTAEADVYIVNTCTVTHKTDYQSRQLIRRAHKRNPHARIIVTGCYAQVAPEALSNMHEVSLILGNAQKEKIAECIVREPDTTPSGVMVSDINRETCFKDPSLQSFRNHTRAFLKIQDGCASFCSYCIVPYARGKPRSLTVEETIKRLFTLSNAGYKEIVLTGIHLGAYGVDHTPPSNLLTLLELIESKKPVPRIRLSSLEPMDITNNLVDFLSTAHTICPHLHLPLQSGDDQVLKRMNRTYTEAEFKKMVTVLMSKIPDLCLGTDVIVGFPGETDDQFNNTYALLKELPISYFHVFPYSKRSKTKAALFPDHIPEKIIKLRGELLRTLGNYKKLNYYSRYIGNSVKVLLEDKRDREFHCLKGRSRNYIPVLVEGGDSLKNQEWSVAISKVEEGRVWGELQCMDYKG
jgi:threonylcarbamoyladenosine tRNA methylthiotransferase MtaB